MHDLIFVILIVVAATVIAIPLVVARRRRHATSHVAAPDGRSDAEPTDAT